MNAKWSFIKVPAIKPLTPTQQALLDAIKASSVRVFDASAWNIRTISALWQAGLIYWNCGPDSDYKQIALIKDAPASAVKASPAPAAPLPVITFLLRYLKALAAWEGAYVEAFLFDDPTFKHEIYEGTIQEVKQTIYGPFVRFSAERGPSHITGSKWIALRNVKGMAAQTQKAAS